MTRDPTPDRRHRAPGPVLALLLCLLPWAEALANEISSYKDHYSTPVVKYGVVMARALVPGPRASRCSWSTTPTA